MNSIADQLAPEIRAEIEAKELARLAEKHGFPLVGLALAKQIAGEMDRVTAAPAPWVGIAMVKQWAEVLRRWA